ncbi:hypothetical protein Tco_0162850 [Tanacetum coccineum]
MPTVVLIEDACKLRPCSSETNEVTTDSIQSTEAQPLWKHKATSSTYYQSIQSLESQIDSIPHEFIGTDKVRRPTILSILYKADHKSCGTMLMGTASSVALVLTSPTVIGLAVELSLTSYLEPRVDKYNLLQGGCSDSGISSLWSTSGGMYRDGSSDDGSKGDECAGRAMHYKGSPLAEGGDSEIGVDWLWIVMPEVPQLFLWMEGKGSQRSGRKGMAAPQPKTHSSSSMVYTPVYMLCTVVKDLVP